MKNMYILNIIGIEKGLQGGYLDDELGCLIDINSICKNTIIARKSRKGYVKEIITGKEYKTINKNKLAPETGIYAIFGREKYNVQLTENIDDLKTIEQYIFNHYDSNEWKKELEIMEFALDHNKKQNKRLVKNK